MQKEVEISNGAEIKISIELSDLIRQIKLIVVETVKEELNQYTITNDNNVALTIHQICKLHHRAPETIKKYIAAGLPVLPDGKISLYDLNEFLGKYGQLKTHHKKNAV